jgi:uncharacterized membrane protein (DUF485 family)
MMKNIIFTCILVIHGIIHSIGLVRDFGSGKRGSLNEPLLTPFVTNSNKFIGSLWLLTLIFFVFAAIFFLLKKEWWYHVAIPAVACSQFLIILNWQDAKFGTIANAIIVTVIVISVASNNFDRMVSKELKLLLSNCPRFQPKIVTLEMLDKLPAGVQSWLKHASVVGKESIQTVHLKQEGRMRIKADGKWMEVKAEQYFTVPNPGFIWFADVNAAPLLSLRGRDKYYAGRGNMLIKLFSIIPVANSKGQEIDQGTMLRYLAEIVWFPTAALSEYITWKEIDSLAAEATMEYKGVKASGVFKFNDQGDVVSFEAQRYYDRKEGATLENWRIEIAKDGYKEIQGIRVPVEAAVTWKLNEGDFTWYKLEIIDIKYNSI